MLSFMEAGGRHNERDWGRRLPGALPEAQSVGSLNFWEHVFSAARVVRRGVCSDLPGEEMAVCYPLRVPLAVLDQETGLSGFEGLECQLDSLASSTSVCDASFGSTRGARTASKRKHWWGSLQTFMFSQEASLVSFTRCS